MREKSIKVKVNDDWYPTYEDGTVEMSLSIYKYEKKDREVLLGCAVWGYDDYGLENTWKCRNKRLAKKKMYKFMREVERAGVVNKEYFKKLGFKCI